MPVDPAGPNVSAGIALCPQARAAYVSRGASSQPAPSCRWRAGWSCSMGAAHRRVVIEDGYDSEFAVPAAVRLPAGLDQRQRVIYIGPFSKVLFPGLRLGFIVLPKDLVAAFQGARLFIDRHPPSCSGPSWPTSCAAAISQPHPANVPTVRRRATSSPKRCASGPDRIRHPSARLRHAAHLLPAEGPVRHSHRREARTGAAFFASAQLHVRRRAAADRSHSRVHQLRGPRLRSAAAVLGGMIADLAVSRRRPHDKFQP